MLKIEGTEYQTVIRRSSMKSRICTGKTDSSAGTSTTLAPAAAAE
jgi:hypothetical protein